MTNNKSRSNGIISSIRLSMLGIASAAVIGLSAVPAQAQSHTGAGVETDFWTCLGLLLSDPVKHAEVCGPGLDIGSGPEPLRGSGSDGNEPDDPPVCDESSYQTANYESDACDPPTTETDGPQ